MNSNNNEHMTESPSQFLNYSSTHRLKKLAEHPIDLTQAGALSPERIAKYCQQACGMKLLYATERVTDEVLAALKELAREAQAIDKMRRMQAGEVLNFIENYPSEKRQVLHTATRDFFSHPQESQQAREAAHKARQEVEKLQSFLVKIELQKKFHELIFIGIGGSILGPQANYYALQHLQKPGRRIHFIANVDPDDTAKVLKEANLKDSLVVVVSKSGTTIETQTNEEFIREKLKEQGLNPVEHVVAVTCPGTPMDNHDRYAEVLYVWDWIGGRFSTSSMVGGILLAFAFGFEVYWDFLKGAHAMDETALQDNPDRNLPLLAALLGIWNRNFLGYPTVAVIPYAQALFRYPAHLQQVSMESNGKSIDKHGRFVAFETGPIIWGEPGTNAQHSFFQLLHQGTNVVPVSMVGFKQSQYGEDIEVEGTTSQEKLLANLFAQAISLAIGQHADNPNKFFPGNRPTQILLADQLTPFTVGALLAFYEHLVAFQGFIWNINSFDQEGVQLGKALAHRLTELFAAGRGKAKESKADPVGEAFLKHLDQF